MNQAIYTYEVELKLTNKNTRETSLVTRTEYAYSVMDACMQSAMNQMAAIGTGSADIEVVHIGPPAEAVRQATKQMADTLARLARVIGQRDTV